MKKNILSIGASGSKNSINQIFANFVAEKLSKDYSALDLSQFLLPLFTADEEIENGFPHAAELIYQSIKKHDILVISLAEHNGSYTAFFKNIFDWLSRLELKFFTDKKIVLLSTAPGPRGGQSVLEAALDRFPRHGGEIIAHFSLPKFKESFDLEHGVIDQQLNAGLNNVVEAALADIYKETN